MLVNTFTQYLFSADYYDFVEETQAGGLEVNRIFSYDRAIRCNITTDGTGRLFIKVPTEETFDIFGRLTNLRDAAGSLVSPRSTAVNDGYVYNIVAVDPVFNPYGFVDYSIYTAVRA